MKPWKKHYLSTLRLRLLFSAGFTLVEILIVSLLLGIIALLGIPTLISALEDTRLTGATAETVTALEFAHFRAMSSGRTIRVTFDVAAETFVVEQFTCTGDLLGGLPTLPETDVETGSFVTIYHPLRPGDDYQIDLSNQPLFGSVDISAADFGGNNSIAFDAFGAPSDGGSVTLDFGSRQAIVNVDALTGKVTVSN